MLVAVAAVKISERTSALPTAFTFIDVPAFKSPIPAPPPCPALLSSYSTLMAKPRLLLLTKKLFAFFIAAGAGIGVVCEGV
jgi:hypothetical protein